MQQTVERLISIPAAAAIAGITRQAMHVWVHRGVGGRKIPTVTVAGRKLIDEKQLRAFLAAK